MMTDREMGHVAVFESPETARATVETMNHAESLEQELEELDRELAETRARLQRAEDRSSLNFREFERVSKEPARFVCDDDGECSSGGDCIESIASPGFCAKCEKEMPCRAPSPSGVRCTLARGHTMAHSWAGSTSEPAPCSCEEALALRKKLEDALRFLTRMELDIGHARERLR